MFLCQSVLCMVAVLLTTSCAVPSKGTEVNIKVPDECKGQRFCDIKPEGYDQLAARIDSLVPDYLMKYHAEKAAASDLEQRTAIVETERHNCLEIKKTRFAYLYFSDGYHVVVQGEKFTQPYEEVLCGEPGEECFQDLKFGVRNFNTICEPIYSYRTLYVFNENKTAITGKRIMTSVACSCTVIPGAL